MKTRSEVWEEYERLQTILKANVAKEIYDDELVGKINALYWVLEQPLGDRESTCSKCGARFYVNDKPFNLLKCSNRHCQRQWIYKGKKTFPSYTSCPDCKGSVRCPGA